MTDQIPDLHVTGAGSGGQFFPRYTYEVPAKGTLLDSRDGDDQDFQRVDNITDSALSDYRKAYGHHISKDDIFHYVYGLLHSPECTKR